MLTRIQRNELTMKKISMITAVFICMVLILSACTIKNSKKMSDEEIKKMKDEYEEYLKETYPDESFTVEIWEEYGKTTGGAGLPDYEGYLIRQVITDSKGNRFKIFTSDEGSSIFDIHRVYSDDYKDVLDGTKYYNEKGQSVYFDDNGEISFISNY